MIHRSRRALLRRFVVAPLLLHPRAPTKRASAQTEGAQPVKAEDVTALHGAVARGDADAVAALLKKTPALVDARTSGGITPLGRAAALGKGAVARLLLEAGADPDLAKPDGATPLHDAGPSATPP